jgi:murein DD-endopeptidase MepM/ murein hydrolase activator NlpD
MLLFKWRQHVQRLRNLWDLWSVRSPSRPARTRSRLPLLRMEPLERRELLAVDLQAVSLSIVQSNSPFAPTTPILGEQVFAKASFIATDLPAGSNYRLEFDLDGVPLSSTVSLGAGVSGSTNQFEVLGGWIATAGAHSLSVTLDADNSISEPDETNNVAVTSFTTADPATTNPPKFVTPIGGVPFQDWAIDNYVDVNPLTGPIVDYLGGTFTIDGHAGHDLTLANFAEMDAGIPVYAAAAGTVTESIDGAFDRNAAQGNQPGNNIIVDHGNGWETEYFDLMANTITVKVGDVVTSGQLLGLTGSSGDSTDAHLHWVVRHNGAVVETEFDPAVFYVNPLPYQGAEPTTILDLGTTNFTQTGAQLKERPADLSTFSTLTPDTITLWFETSHFHAGDQYQINWYQPDGTLSQSFSRTVSDDEGRSFHTSTISSSVWSALPGTWRVAVAMGAQELASTTFNITTGVGVPNINVLDGSTIIDDHRTTADDFGAAALGDAAPSRTYTIQNTGTSELDLLNLSLPPGFSLNGTFPTAVAAGDTATFTVNLDTTRAGDKFGSIQFTTNDPESSTFNFHVSGTITGAAPAGAPVITLPAAALAYPGASYGHALVIDPAATVTDADSLNFGGGSLTVGFTEVSSSLDTLAIRNVGTGPGQIGISAANVTFGGVIIGTFAGGSAGTPLTISFNSNATPAVAQELIRNVTFATAIVRPETLSRYVRFSLTDGAGGNASNDAIAVVAADTPPPILSNAGFTGATINENDVATLTATLSDLSPLDTFTLVVNWADGSAAQIFTNLPSGAFTATHQYLDNLPRGATSTFAANLTLTDSSNATAPTVTVLVTLNDLPPTLSNAGFTTATINENDMATLTAALSDPGTLDTFALVVDWADGSAAQTFTNLPSGAFTATHRYLDNLAGQPTSTFLVNLALTDDDGAAAPVTTAALTLNNLPPTLTGAGFVSATINENGVATLTATLADPGTRDTFSLVVDWADGSAPQTFGNLPSGAFAATHVYLDNLPKGLVSTFSVRLALSDDDGGAAPVSTVTVQVNNLPPTISGAGFASATVNENDVATLTATLSDPGVLDTFSLVVNWADGSALQTYGNLPSGSFTATHQYLHNFPNGPTTTYLVNLAMTDDDGAAAQAATAALTLNKLPPTVSGVGFVSTTVNENDVGTLTGTLSDVDLQDTFSLVLNWDDGSTPQTFANLPSGAFSYTHQYLDNFPSGTVSNTSVILTATDSDGGVSSATAVETVNNLPPTLNGQAFVVSAINEGEVATLTATLSDPGTLDTFSVVVNWADGSAPQTFSNLSSGAFTATHLYLDNVPSGLTSTFSVGLTLTDDDGSTAPVATAAFTLNNLAPTLTGAGFVSVTINENDIATLTATLSDPGPLDTFSLVVDWADGSAPQTLGNLPSGALTVTHRYLDNVPHDAISTFSVNLAVTDDDGSSAPVSTVTVQVNNQPPTISGTGFASATVNENDVATLTATLSDPGSLDTFSLVVNWADGSALQTYGNLPSGAFTATHQYLHNFPNGPTTTYVVNLAMTDDDGAAAQAATATLTLNKLSPTVSGAGFVSTTINENEVGTLTGTLSDTSPLDTFSLVLSWGDGSTPQTFTNLPSGAFTYTHQYLDNVPSGTVSNTPVILTVTDSDGGVSSATAVETVNNLPPTLSGQAFVVSAINEGEVATLTATLSDPGTLDTFSLVVNWADGSAPQTFSNLSSGAFSATHLYLDNVPSGLTSTFSVGLTLTDDDGSTAPVATAAFTLNNLPPTLSGAGFVSVTINENDVATLTATLSDPGPLDTLSLVVDWADGSAPQTFANLPSGALTVTHKYLDNVPHGQLSTFSVNLALTDDDGSSAPVSTVTVQVNNLAPTISGAGFASATVNENDVATLTATLSDPGPLDTFSLVVNWADGSALQTYGNLPSGAFTATHQYLHNFPNGPTTTFLVNLAMTDDDGAAAQAATATLTLNKLPPTVSSVGFVSTTINENDVGTLTGTLSDTSPLDTFSLVLNWGDGSTPQTFANLPSGAFSYTHQYLDNFPSGTVSNMSVTLTATDNDGGVTTVTPVETVNNLPPTLSGQAFVVSTINEGSVATLTATLSDPGTLDTFSVVVNWADGSAPQTFSNLSSGAFTATHLYLDNMPGGLTSTFSVGLTLTDDDGSTAPVATAAFTLNNLPPTLSGAGFVAATINENGVATLTGTLSDPGTLDTFSLVVDWADGSAPQTFANLPSGALTVTHRYLDNVPHGAISTFSVNLAVTDDDGSSAPVSTVTLQVSNLPPTLSNAGFISVTINENDVATLTATLSDPGTLDTFSLVINWADGSAPQTYGNLSSGSFTATHQYLDNVPSGLISTFLVNLALTDDDEASALAVTTALTLNNLPPTVTGVGFLSSTINENGVGTLTGALADTGLLDTFSLVLNWGDGGTPQTFTNLPSGTFTYTHQYLDNIPSGAASNSLVILTVADDDGGVTTATAVETIVNLPPTVSGQGFTVSTMNEGSVATLTATLSDPGTLDTLSLVVNWADGGAPQTFGNLSSGTFTATHLYLDNIPSGLASTFSVGLALTDDDGATASVATAALTLNNLPPTLSGAGFVTATINENGVATLTATLSDPGPLDTFSLVVDWADGSAPQTFGNLPSGSFTATHTYLDNVPHGQVSTFSVSLALTDDDSGAAPVSTVTVQVNNLPPTLTGAGFTSATINENDVATLTAALSDPGTLDTFSLVINWADGSAPQTYGNLSSGSFTATHRYLDNVPSGLTSTFLVDLALTDDDGTSALAVTTALTLNNLPPTVSGVGFIASTINESAIGTLTGTLSDTGLLDTFSLVLNWGDGGTPQTFTNLASGTFTYTHQYLDNFPSGAASNSLVILTVADDDGSVTTATAVETIINLPPTVSGQGFTVSTTNEGSVATLTATLSDPGTLDTLSLVVNWADGGAPQTFGNLSSGTFTATHLYLDNIPSGLISTFSVGLALADDDGATAQVATAALTLNNLPPTLSGAGFLSATINENSVATLTATLSDPGPLDTFVLVVDWADGSAPQTFSNLPSGSFTATHRYMDSVSGGPASTFLVSLAVTDDDGQGAPITTTSLILNNLPPTLTNAGFTSGTINENEVATLTATLSDPGPLDTFSLVIDWADGSAPQTFGNLPSGSFIATHRYLDNFPKGTVSTFSASMALTDDDGSAAPVSTVSVQVANLPPTLSNPGFTSATINENDVATLTASLSDPGPLDTFSLVINWADGSDPQTLGNLPSGSFTVTHLYPDNLPSGPTSTFTVSLALADDDGGLAPVSSVTVQVNNLPPTLSGAGFATATINENDVATLTATLSDPGSLDTFSLVINWADGSAPQTYANLPSGSFTATHQYLDNLPSGLTSTFLVNLALTDDDGTSAQATTAPLTLNNLPPTVSGVGFVSTTINENSVGTLTGTLSDAGRLDTFSLVLNWGDASTPQTFTNLPSGAFTYTHQYLASLPSGTASNMSAILTVTDDDGGVTTATAVETIINLPPTISGQGFVVSAINEGSVATLTATLSDPGTSSALTLVVNWADGSAPQTFSSLSPGAFTATHPYLDNIPTGPVSIFPVSLSLTDNDGGQTSAVAIETVNNVAPTANAGGNRIIAAGLPITLSGTETDPGTLDTFTFLWHLVSDTNGQSIGDSTTQTLAFTSSTAGSYTFTFTVTDDDGGVGVDTAVVVSPGASMSNVAATTPISENNVTTLTGNIINSGTDTLTLTIDWSDGSAPSNLNFAFSATSFTVTHRYTDNTPSGPSSNFTVRLALSDQQAHVSMLNTNVVVNDLPPTLTGVNATTLTILEGSTATLTGTVSDPGPLDTFTFVVQWGDGQVQSVTNQPSGAFTLTHQYLGTIPGQSASGFSVSVVATDDDGLASAASTATITVNNVAPSLAGLGFSSASVNEGGTALLTGTITDPGAQDTFALVVDWGDGDVQTVQNLTGGAFALNHKYLGTLPGQAISNFTVNARVTDDDAAASPAGTVVIAVNDVTPSLSGVAIAPSTINENGIAILTGVISDPGVLNTFALVINWNDGNVQTISNLAAGVFSAAHRYVDNIPHGSVSNFTVSVSAVDNDAGVSAISTAAVVVNNLAPTVNAGGNQTGTVGAITTLHGTAADASPLDTFTYLWHLVGDSNGQSLPNSTSPAYAFIPSSGGTYTFNFTVTDDDGGVGVDTAIVTVTGSGAPTLNNLTTNTSINENGVATLNGNLNNGGVDSMTLVVNWSDGTAPQTLNFSATATSFTTTHRYLDNVPSGPSSNATVRLTLSDQHGNSSQSTSQVIVNDLPPTVTGLHVTTASINENDVATLSATVTDPGTLDTLTLVVNWGDSAPQTLTNQSSGAFVFTHLYLDNIPHGQVSNFTVSLSATDDDGLSAAAATTVESVRNVPPTAHSGGNRTITAGTALTLTGTQTDPGTLDTFTYLWHLVGDTNGQTIGNTTTQNLVFTPTSAGTYTFSFTVTDDDGGVGVDTAVVIAQPTGSVSTSTFHFDFNSASGITAPGYLGVRGLDTFTAARTYGWLNTAAEFDRSAPSALLRDGAWGADNTFRVAIDPSQTSYTVLVTLGDNSYARNVNVYAEGALAGTISTNAGQFKTLSFTIATSSVSPDGILDLEFKHAGADPYFVVNGLDIVGSLLQATQPAAAGSTAPALTNAELAPVVQDAIARWTATGISSSQVELLKQTQVKIEDIPTSTVLGMTLTQQVVIDSNAAGYGWYIDAAPHSDAAFSQQISPTELIADPTSPAYGHMDLLTVVMHELGHELGFGDLSATAAPYGLMAESITTGIRRLPSAVAPSVAAPTNASAPQSLGAVESLPTTSDSAASDTVFASLDTLASGSSVNPSAMPMTSAISALPLRVETNLPALQPTLVTAANSASISGNTPRKAANTVDAVFNLLGR